MKIVVEEFTQVGIDSIHDSAVGMYGDRIRLPVF